MLISPREAYNRKIIGNDLQVLLEHAKELAAAPRQPDLHSADFLSGLYVYRDSVVEGARVLGNRATAMGNVAASQALKDAANAAAPFNLYFPAPNPHGLRHVDPPAREATPDELAAAMRAGDQAVAAVQRAIAAAPQPSILPSILNPIDGHHRLWTKPS